MKTLLVKFNAYVDRMGSLHGLFLVHDEVWNTLQYKEWCAYDVLGKHSEIGGTFSDEGEYEVYEATDDRLKALAEIFAFNIENLDITNRFQPYPTVTVFGFNPVNYVSEEDSEEEDIEDDE